MSPAKKESKEKRRKGPRKAYHARGRWRKKVLESKNGVLFHRQTLRPA